MTAVAPADVAGVPVRVGVVRVYLRHVYVAAAAPPDPLWVNAAVASRWHTDDGTLYVAEDELTVWAEWCRNAADQVAAADPTGGVGLRAATLPVLGPRELDDRVQARALFSVDVLFQRLADFTSPLGRAALRAAGIDPQTLLGDDYGACPDIAKAGQPLGWEGVRAPSAARPTGASVAIFQAAHPPRAAWTLRRPYARATVATAYLTRYRAGERPPWLGAEP